MIILRREHANVHVFNELSEFGNGFGALECGFHEIGIRMNEPLNGSFAFLLCLCTTNLMPAIEEVKIRFLLFFLLRIINFWLSRSLFRCIHIRMRYLFGLLLYDKNRRIIWSYTSPSFHSIGFCEFCSEIQ